MFLNTAICVPDIYLSTCILPKNHFDNLHESESSSKYALRAVTRSISSVSYTHLVLKIAVRDVPSFTTDDISNEPPLISAAILKSGTPVSYTHLDVYKRQRRRLMCLYEMRSDVRAVARKLENYYDKGDMRPVYRKH